MASGLYGLLNVFRGPLFAILVSRYGDSIRPSFRVNPQDRYDTRIPLRYRVHCVHRKGRTFVGALQSLLMVTSVCCGSHLIQANVFRGRLALAEMT
jgi:hypothetical protein